MREVRPGRTALLQHDPTRLWRVPLVQNSGFKSGEDAIVYLITHSGYSSAKIGIIKKNTAARYKSKLHLRLKALTGSAQK